MDEKGLWEVRGVLYRRFVKLGLDRLGHRLGREVMADLKNFLGGEKLLRREHLVEIFGAFGVGSEETNSALRFADYEELKEGEAADGTKIADLEKRVARLEEAVRAHQASESRKEIEAKYPHGLGLAP